MNIAMQYRFFSYKSEKFRRYIYIAQKFLQYLYCALQYAYCDRIYIASNICAPMYLIGPVHKDPRRARCLSNL